jgi:hypothetical protein
LNPREKKKAKEVIKTKKKMLRLKRIDPDNRYKDESDTKEDEPEITVDSKGTVSLKPKESDEEKEEKAKEAARKVEPVMPLTPPAAAKTVAAPVAQNSTHEVVPVVENVAKEVTTKDPSTGVEKKEVVKVPEVKNKVVPKKSATVPVATPLEQQATAPLASAPLASAAPLATSVAPGVAVPVA